MRLGQLCYQVTHIVSKQIPSDGNVFKWERGGGH